LSDLEIIDEGLNETDEICEKSLNFMTRIFGNEVSNFAVDTLPSGGIFLLGDKTHSLKDLLTKSNNNPFLEGYKSKGSEVNESLSKFPIYIVNTANLTRLGSYILLRNDINFP